MTVFTEQEQTVHSVLEIYYSHDNVTQTTVFTTCFFFNFFFVSKMEYLSFFFQVVLFHLYFWILSEQNPEKN